MLLDLSSDHPPETSTLITFIFFLNKKLQGATSKVIHWHFTDSTMAPHKPLDCDFYQMDENDSSPELQKTSLTPVQYKPRHRVSFSSQISGKLIPTRKQYSANEIAAMYMSVAELNKTRKEARETLLIMRSGTVSEGMEDNECFCRHGLEGGFHSGNNRRKKALEAVMGEQRLQEDEGYKCTELLAMSYTEFSDAARDEALQLGLDNAREVDGFHE